MRGAARYVDDLPAVVDPVQAMAPGAPVLCDEAPDNVAAEMRHGDPKATEAAFARDDEHVREARMQPQFGHGAAKSFADGQQADIPLLYISTAGIFDGKKESYDDWDQPNPLGVYARSKYMGERFVVENARRFLVCRAGWMMGAGPSKDKKFIQKLMKQLKEGKKELFIVDDKDGTPTYTHDFAKNVKALIRKEYWGLYNMVCGGQTSRLEVAGELLKLMGLENEVKITSVNSDYFKQTYFAERPPCERLVNKKLELRGVNLMQDWKSALHQYINAYYTDYLK